MRKSSKILQNGMLKRHNGLSKERKCEPSRRGDSRELKWEKAIAWLLLFPFFSFFFLFEHSLFLGFLLRKLSVANVFLCREDVIEIIFF